MSINVFFKLGSCSYLANADVTRYELHSFPVKNRLSNLLSEFHKCEITKFPFGWVVRIRTLIPYNSYPLCNKKHHYNFYITALFDICLHALFIYFLLGLYLICEKRFEHVSGGKITNYLSFCEYNFPHI